MAFQNYNTHAKNTFSAALIKKTKHIQRYDTTLPDEANVKKAFRQY